MWLFPHFIWEPVKAALSQEVTGDKGSHQREGELTTYYQVVNCFLETYAADDVIAVVIAGITVLEQRTGINCARYSETLCEKAGRYGIIYNKLVLIGMFIARLCSTIRNCMHTYREAHKRTALHSLASYAKNLVKLREGSHTPTSSMR